MSALPIFPISHTGEKYTKKNMIGSPPRKKNYKASPRKEEIQKWKNYRTSREHHKIINKITTNSIQCLD
jgi:hypothetical protein